MYPFNEYENETSTALTEASSETDDGSAKSADMLTMTNQRLEHLTIEVAQLKDLFVRRLYEDRQKAALIEHVTTQAKATMELAQRRALEPVIKEVLLAVDRLLQMSDIEGGLASVADEIIEVFARRGLERIRTDGDFDPAVHEAVQPEELANSTTHSPNAESHASGTSQIHTIRPGYLFNQRLLRPAQVIIVSST